MLVRKKRDSVNQYQELFFIILFVENLQKEKTVELCFDLVYEFGELQTYKVPAE